MRKLIASLQLLFVVCPLLKGQSLNHIGVMPTIDHSGSITKHLDYSFYYFGMANLYNDQVAGLQDKTNLFAFYSEQALSYKLQTGLSLTASYVYERQNPFDNIYRNENRFYIQGTYVYKVNKINVKHRLRFDGRFVQNRVTGDAPFTHRARYLTGIVAPISKSKKTYLSLYNEFFFNTYKGANAIYGENWAYGAIGVKTGENSSIEAGPLYVFWVMNNTLNNFYYLQLTWSTHMNFTKNKTKQ